MTAFVHYWSHPKFGRVNRALLVILLAAAQRGHGE